MELWEKMATSHGKVIVEMGKGVEKRVVFNKGSSK